MSDASGLYSILLLGYLNEMSFVVMKITRSSAAQGLN